MAKIHPNYTKYPGFYNKNGLQNNPFYINLTYLYNIKRLIFYLLKII